MNLIIEAGGTKSNLVFVNNGETIASYNEPGLQLTRETAEDFEKKIGRWAGFQPGPINTVFLFAAGKTSIQKEEVFKKLIQTAFSASQVFMHSDLLAACYATAGNNPGLVGILGTGSNSCYYDGTVIIKNVAPGGFILGDEGSGVHIGKMALRDYLRSDMPISIKEELEAELVLSAESVIANMYGGTIREAANFCSSITPFITNHLSNEYCYNICSLAIRNYLSLLNSHYKEYSERVYLVGSTAYYLKDILNDEASQFNLEIVKITQHPVKDLSIFLAGKYQL